MSINLKDLPRMRIDPMTEMERSLDRVCDENERLRVETARLQREIDYPTCQNICPEVRRLARACNEIKSQIDVSAVALLDQKRKTPPSYYVNLKDRQTIVRLRNGRRMLIRDDGVVLTSADGENWTEESWGE